MNVQAAFEILEIEITQEQRVIKRAYAQLVKRYHPEENPTEWQRVHDAYECAMNYAGRKQDIADGIAFSNENYENPIVWELEKEESRFAVEMPVQEETEFNFQNIENLFEQESKKRRDEQDNVLVDALNRMSELEKKKKIPVKQWSYVLGTPEIQAARTNSAFLYCLGDFLKNAKVDTSGYNVIRGFLYDVNQELQGDLFRDESANARLAAFNVVAEALEEAYWVRGSGAIKKIFNQDLFIIIVMVIAMIGLVLFYDFIYGLDEHKDPNQVILQLEEVDAQGRLWFGKRTSLPSKYAKTNWWVWSGEIREKFRDKYELDSEGDIAICFCIGNYDVEIDDVIAFVYMKDFGLESGNYEVWQYDGEKYRSMTIYNVRNDASPYEKMGKLYMPIKVHKVEDDSLGVDEYHPVVIMRTDSKKVETE